MLLSISSTRILQSSRGGACMPIFLVPFQRLKRFPREEEDGRHSSRRQVGACDHLRWLPWRDGVVERARHEYDDVPGTIPVSSG